MKKTIMNLLVLAYTLAVLNACSDKVTFIPVPQTFVLVHGAWQAPYVWDHVKAQLEAAGQRVIVVELPAHGSDTTSAALVTIEAYSAKVIAAITATHKKVILVGHSMGGVVVTDVAQKIPTQISKLIYIGAFVPASGQSLLDLANTDAQSHLGPSLVPSADQLTLDVKHDSIVPVFIQDGAPAIRQLVIDKYRAEPAIPFINKVTLTAAGYGSVDKYYIRTLQDHAIGTDLQNRMITAAGITKVYSLQSSHCPFLSMPDSVSNLLLNIIQ
jgi:pimeloyl-ACP methyl ester carboxylesterase